MRKIDFGSARKWAEEMHREILENGDIAMDATMGNGYDTERLCRLVGETGKVYAFDVQKEALDSTRGRLSRAGFSERAELILAGHEQCARFVPGGIALAAFNLGWLPGAEHRVTTLASTTVAACDAALTLLKPGGLLTVCVYPGHEEGAKEMRELGEWSRSLSASAYDVLARRYVNQPNDPPVLIAVKIAEKPRVRR